MSRFLRYRYTAFLGWVLLIIGSIVATIAMTDGIESDPLRVMLRWGTLAVTVVVGMRVQRWVLRRADPRGELRAELRRISEWGHRRGERRR